ncbi:MAG TPA: DUF2336 domain-containing protein [Xanthobacteraceae bacterium]|nr:DUF2336 domain-containing protein [Xanthobacteraceae bacterium]
MADVRHTTKINLLEQILVGNPKLTSRSMSSFSLLSELEESLKSGSPEKRVHMLRRVTDVLLRDADRLNEQQIRVFDDVLVHLIQRVETKALADLSTSLAPVNNAPIEVIRRLSRHDELAVAGPVLAQSNRLSKEDLIDVARTKSQGHLLIMSGRPSLPAPVTDVLIERGDMQVHKTLARNPGTQFSEHGFAALVKKSEGDDELAERLGLRLDIPLHLLRQLLARATDLVRSRLLAATPPENEEKIHRALASIADEVGQEAVRPRDFAQADNDVTELNRRGKLNEATLVGFATQREYEKMTATLALFCGVKSKLIERLLQKVRHDGLIVACKAAKLSWPTVELILKSRFSHHLMSDEELRVARDDFLELSQASAQRTIRFMQVQETAKKAC